MAPIQPSSATNGMNHTTHTTNGTQPSINSSKPKVLHLGDPILYNHALYTRLHSHFEIIRLDICELHRSVFIKHLKDKTWGDFSAIMRPFWNTGGEMGKWDRELIELLPKSMKVMASAGAGYDWVDTKTLGEHGILYTNGAGASTESVADMALWLIISVFRQMTWSSLAARSNNPADFQKAHQKTMFTSYNPSGRSIRSTPKPKSLGIVGLGNIGFAIAKKVRAALEMRILYHDIERKSTAQEQEIDATYHPSLEDLLENSDCILLASPGGPTILNAHTLSRLKRGSRVVNVARGSLIDEDALADSLESGHISAAGLDVHTEEPHPNPRLIERRDVTATCHTGGGSVETIQGFETLVMENVEAVLKGEKPLTAVNKHFLRDTFSGMNGHVNGNHNHNYDDGNDQHHLHHDST